MSLPQTPIDPIVAARHPHPQAKDDDLDVAGLTDQGKRRKTNQDHFLICSLHKAMRVRGTSLPHPEQLEIPSERLALFAMVADGVGSTKGGEEASRAALETVATYATQTMNCYYASDPGSVDSFLDGLRQVAGEVQASVIARGEQKPDLAGLATTLTIAISVWPSLYLLHIGDSRAYLFREGTLRQLTRDQTLAQELVDSGAMPAERVEKSPFAHVLSSAVGGESHPMVARFDSEPKDIVMLCTDGLTKHVTDARIAEVLGSMKSADQACRILVDEALEAGGTDNVTVFVGRGRRGRMRG